MDEARCARYVAFGGKYLWYSDEKAEQDRAKDICLDCPVFSECEAYLKRNRTMLCGVYAGVYYGYRSDEDAPTKTCKSCFEDKVISDFYEKKSGNLCKTCWNLRSNEAKKRRAHTMSSVDGLLGK